MFAGDVDGLARVYDEALLLAVQVHRLKSLFKTLGRKIGEIRCIESGKRTDKRDRTDGDKYSPRSHVELGNLIAETKSRVMGKYESRGTQSDKHPFGVLALTRKPHGPNGLRKGGWHDRWFSRSVHRDRTSIQ
jgi:hypothetical protein